jgi:transketolase
VESLEHRQEFKLGKAEVLAEGGDLAIISCGIMMQEALSAVKSLASKGIKARLINMHTIRPLDNQAILEAAKSTKGIVVCEEHSVIGGLASAVDEVVSENFPVRVLCLGVRNRYGQSGEPADLMKEYNLTSADIEKAALKIIS